MARGVRTSSHSSAAVNHAIDAERQFQTNEVTGYRRAIRCLADCVVASEGAPMLQQPGPRQHPGVGAWEFQVFARGPWTA